MIDKDALEKLLANQPPEIRTKGVLLFNGMSAGARAYQAEGSSSNLKNWQASEAAMNDFVESLTRSASIDAEQFKTLADVLVYLKENSWQSTKTTIHRHNKEGKIIPRPDGVYHLKDVDKYARAFLKEQSTGKRLQGRIDELQRKKLDLELDNLKIDNRRKQRADDREAGLSLPREQMEREFAALAGIFDAALKNWIQSGAADWVRLVNGDIKKAGELITVLNRDLDAHINNLSKDQEYEIVIDEEDGDESETETEKSGEEDES